MSDFRSRATRPPGIVDGMTNDVVFSGVDAGELRRVLAAGVDHGGNRIDAFTDDEGGWPLRCCLGRSRPGDVIAIVAWSPFHFDGPYRETGPIAVHAAGDCPGFDDDLHALPAELDASPMVLRPYGHDHRIAYDLVTHVAAGSSLTDIARALLERDDVDVVHARNVTGGCWAFTAARAAAA